MGMGIPQEKISAFDHHSSIELNFKNINPIIITTTNNMTWMWSTLEKLNSGNITFHAGHLLESLQHALPGVLTGQAVLGKEVDHYEIKALLTEEYTESPEKLSLALNEFYNLMTSIHNRLSN